MGHGFPTPLLWPRFAWLPPLSSATHVAFNCECSEIIKAVAWLERYLSCLMSWLFSFCALWCERVECRDWCVFLRVCVFGDTPTPKLGMQVFVCARGCACVCFCFTHFTHFLSLTLFFPFLLPLFNVLLLLFYSPSLSSYRDCVHSCQEGWRCLWSGLDKDQASPSCCPHPLPGKMVAPSLAEHQLLFECTASRDSGDLSWFVSLLLRVCPEPLAATPITKGGTDLEFGGGEGEVDEMRMKKCTEIRKKEVDTSK